MHNLVGGAQVASLHDLIDTILPQLGDAEPAEV